MAIISIGKVSSNHTANQPYWIWGVFPTSTYSIFFWECIWSLLCLLCTSWVCETYVVYHLVSTGLYVVHHRPVLCTTNLCCAPWCARRPVSIRCGGHPRHFSFFDGAKGKCKKRHFLYKCIVFFWLTINMQIKVQFCTDIHFVSAQHSFVPIRWCTRRVCMFVINFFMVYNAVLSVSVVYHITWHWIERGIIIHSIFSIGRVDCEAVYALTLPEDH